MRVPSYAAAAACALTLGACATDMHMGGGADTSVNPGGAATSPAAPITAADYVAEAARSDMYEIQSSQLALSKSSSQKVKDFANQMIRDHTRSTQMVTAAAQSAGLTAAPPPLDPRRAGLISQLQGASGADFDRMYLRQQLMAHQEALALHQGYAANGDNPALKRVAGEIAPIVQQHLTMVQTLQP